MITTGAGPMWSSARRSAGASSALLVTRVHGAPLCGHFLSRAAYLPSCLGRGDGGEVTCHGPYLAPLGDRRVQEPSPMQILGCLGPCRSLTYVLLQVVRFFAHVPLDRE